MRIILAELRNEEWFQFHTEFKTLVEQYTPQALDISELFTSFLSLYADADEALEFILKSAITSRMVEADNARDRIFRGLADTIKSAQNHFDIDKQEASQRLQILFAHYGNLARKSYDQETASLYNLIQDLRNETYAPDISALGLGDWVTRLEADNQAFENLMKERYAETSEKTDLRMVEVRTKTDRNYRDILDRLDALMLINGETKYAPFVKVLNVRTERFSKLIAQRKGRNAKTKKSI